MFFQFLTIFRESFLKNQNISNFLKKLGQNIGKEGIVPFEVWAKLHKISILWKILEFKY